MARNGDHRVRHLARWVATPILLLAAGVVVFAAYERHVPILIGAAIAALGAGIVAVVIFDIELIRSRRAHGADRVAQARAYAAMYAAHVRVMAEGFALAQHSTHAHTNGNTNAHTNGNAHAKAASVVDTHPGEGAEPVVAEAVQRPTESGTDTDTDGAAEMWETVRDAPTVVDLMAWEIRARVAAEQERERQEKGA